MPLRYNRRQVILRQNEIIGLIGEVDSRGAAKGSGLGPDSHAGTFREFTVRQNDDALAHDSVEFTGCGSRSNRRSAFVSESRRIHIPGITFGKLLASSRVVGKLRIERINAVGEGRMRAAPEAECLLGVRGRGHGHKKLEKIAETAWVVACFGRKLDANFVGLGFLVAAYL